MFLFCIFASFATLFEETGLFLFSLFSNIELETFNKDKDSKPNEIFHFILKLYFNACHKFILFKKKSLHLNNDLTKREILQIIVVLLNRPSMRKFKFQERKTHTNKFK